MSHRKPAVAGQFYPSEQQACRAEAEAYLAADAKVPAGEDAALAGMRAAVAEGSEELIGGVVPHAGWICSGAIAAAVLRELVWRTAVETFVVFGAAHRLAGETAALYGHGAWSTPLGEMAIDEDLASAVVSSVPDVCENEEPHLAEHSIEVQLPFLQQLMPEARLLPILVPHTAPGPAIGMAVAEQARLLQREVAFIGSTDLTHYGPRYGFTPKGAGADGLEWARNVNDRAFIDLVCAMEADRVAPEARRHQNACGAGATAATIAACRRSGATRGVLLRHATSNEVLAGRFGRMSDAVGYAGIVFARPCGR